MLYVILLLFLLVALLVYLEPFMGKYKLSVYLFLCTVMTLVAAFRPIGFDPDSYTYEMYYRNYLSLSDKSTVEFSYLFFSSILNNITTDVHAIFLLYAIISVPIHFYTFRKYTEFWFLPVLVYLGFYYEVHELTQIRTSVLSAMFLLAIKPLAEGKRLIAFVLLAMGSFFHYSGLMFIPILFLSNKHISVLERWFWVAVIPASYILYYTGASIMMNYEDIPYISEKLLNYQESEEKGVGVASVLVFGFSKLLMIMLFYYLLFFYDTISAKFKYASLMMRIFAIGIAAYAGLGFFPVLGDRIGYQLQMVNIFLFSYISYTIRPRWVGCTVVLFISFIYLNYVMPQLFGINLLWKA